jgi:drug/metabolite transporter (DMT)-like permease
MKVSVGSQRQARARVEVLLGALAFGASVPAGKILLRELPPLIVSGGLYLSAGLFCSILIALDSLKERKAGPNRVQGGEWLWLGAAVLAGGVLGPIALFYGLRMTDAYVAGLLLNFEAVFTVGLGILIFAERVGRRGTGGILLILMGALLLSGFGSRKGRFEHVLGPALVVGACACWAFDNNFTRRVSLRDARQIVAVKGLVGGSASVVLAIVAGQVGHWPGAAAILWVALVGSLSYGLSIVLFIRGLRELGVVHTGALFALAPGFAATLSWLFLREPMSPTGLVALLSMTIGALLLSTDVHDHAHTHEALEHAHEHEHDEHHQHEHRPGELEQVPHAHWHRHEVLNHSHPHTHDAHHRHSHRTSR